MWQADQDLRDLFDRWKRVLAGGTASLPEIETLKQRLLKLENEPPPSKKKDVWDKLSALSSLASGIVVAIIGFYATNVYDRGLKETEEAQKNRTVIATELQTVEKFLPYLASKDEKTKEAVILAVSSLGNTPLAAKLATLFGGSGANAALTSRVPLIFC